MKNVKLPLKFSVFKCVAESDRPVTSNDIFTMLKDTYGTEKQFTKKRIELYLTALSCVAMIRENNIDFDKDNELEISYEMTSLGKSRVKYLPEE